jgi:cysteine synthase
VVPRGLTPGQRVVVTCAGSGVVGNRVAFYLPKKKKSLVLCEVDVHGSVVVAKRKRTGRKLAKSQRRT